MIVKRFTASWCGPCKVLKPIFQELEIEFPLIEFETVNIEEEFGRSEADGFGVRSIPTVIFMKEEKEVGRIIGALPKFTYEDKLNELIP